MNVFGKRERSWRKARKRGVSPIIATILLVAITVVLAAVLYVLISGLTTGGSNKTPIGGSFGYGTVQPVNPGTTGCASTAGEVCYSIGIGSTSSAATTANINFQLQLNGATQSSSGTITLLSQTGGKLATFSLTSGTWTAVSPATLPQALGTANTLVLDSGGTASLSGYTLVAIGVGSLQGTTPANLP